MQHRFRKSPENYLAALEEKLFQKSLPTEKKTAAPSMVQRIFYYAATSNCAVSSGTIVPERRALDLPCYAIVIA
jgi:hypothetical protein